MKKTVMFLIVILLANLVFAQKANEREKALVSVDEAAMFPGGAIEEQRYLSQNLIFPNSVGDIDSKVVFQFIVEKDGSITNIIQKRKLLPSIDEIALKVIQNMPKWVPAKKNEEVVRQLVQYPILIKRKKRK